MLHACQSIPKHSFRFILNHYQYCGIHNLTVCYLPSPILFLCHSPSPSLAVANLLFIFDWILLETKGMAKTSHLSWIFMSEFEPSKEQQKKRLRISKTINWIVMQQSKWKQPSQPSTEKKPKLENTTRISLLPNAIYISIKWVDERTQDSSRSFVYLQPPRYYLFDKSILYTFPMQ